MRSVILIAHVKEGQQEELVRLLRLHEPTEAYLESGVNTCVFFAGKGHLAVFIETNDDFQTAYAKLVTSPSWKGLFYKIGPMVEGLPALSDFPSSAAMPFAGEITYWQAEAEERAPLRMP